MHFVIFIIFSVFYVSDYSDKLLLAVKKYLHKSIYQNTTNTMLKAFLKEKITLENYNEKTKILTLWYKEPKNAPDFTELKPFFFTKDAENFFFSAIEKYKKKKDPFFDVLFDEVIKNVLNVEKESFTKSAELFKKITPADTPREFVCPEDISHPIYQYENDNEYYLARFNQCEIILYIYLILTEE